MDKTGQFPADRIYVATSWRNALQPSVVQHLAGAGYDVYDFRKDGFAWHDVDPDWKHQESTPLEFIAALQDPISQKGFDRDYQALQNADIVVCLLPCERDAHTELGWAIAAGKETHIVLDNPCKASLMYAMADHIHADVAELYVNLGIES